MAKQILHDQRVWLGGYDLSGAINSLALDSGVETRDAATLTDNTRVQLAGLKSAAATVEGYFETATGIDEELFDRIGLADAPLSYAASGAAEGDTAYSMLSLLAEYSPGGTVGDMFGFSAAAQPAPGDGLVRGTLMHNAARSAGANGTGRELGAVADGQKLFGALHVTVVAGTAPALDVTVESDDNAGFTTATTRMTFAQQTSIGFEWATPIAGPITDTWWRVVWAIGGSGGPSFTFPAILAIQ